MKKIRIGNDIEVLWQIYNSEGSAYNLTGKDITVELIVKDGESTTGSDIIPIENFSRGTNNILFTFYGKDQKRVGEYYVKLCENRGKAGMKTLDMKEAFYLVPHSWQTGGSDSSVTVTPTTINIDGRITTGLRGESAYEVAVENGYTGTVQEWLTDTVNGIKGVKGDKGDKGDQGNSGYTGAAGELEVVNNLTSGGATSALSAEMGKTLAEADKDTKGVLIGGRQYGKTATQINLSQGTEYNGWILNNNGHAYYNSTTGRKFVVFAISSADTIKITMGQGKTSKLAYLKSSTVTVNSNLPACTGKDEVIDVNSGENVFPVPSDCTHVAIGTYVSSSVAPDSISTNKYTVSDGGAGVLDSISSIDSELTSLSNVLGDNGNILLGGKRYSKAETQINLSQATEYDGWILNNNGHAYYNPTTGRKFIVFAVSSADTIEITMTQNKTSKMAYLKSSTVTVSSNLDTCVGEDRVIDVSSGENIFYVPSDCTHIALGTYASGDLTPQGVSTFKYTLNKGGAGILDDISSLGSSVTQLRYTLEDRVDVNLSSGTEYAGWITTNNSKVLYNKTTYPSRKFVIVAMPSGKQKLDVVMSSGVTTKLAFLKSATAVEDTNLDACLGETGVRDVLSGSNTYTVPDDCRFIAVGTLASSSVTPTSIKAYTEIGSLISDLQNAADASLPKLNRTLLDSYGTTISKFDTEKLAHINNIAFAKGYFYIPYVADESNWQESYSLRTNFIRLAVVPLCDPTKTKWYDVAKVDDTIGGVTIGSSVTCPHDPTVAYKDGYVYILLRASVGGKAVELCRRFNPSTMTLENSLTVLKLNGSDFDNTSVVAAYNTICQTSISEIEGPSMDFNSRVVLASDGYYYGAVGGLATNFYGIIVRSSDLLNWTAVSANNITRDSMSGEVNIAEMSAGTFLVAYRDQSYNTTLMTFTLGDNYGTWSEYKTIENSVRSRPCPFEYNGETYVAMNVTGTSKNISGYGEAIRQNLAIYKVDSSLNLTEVALLHRDCSIQYPALVVANENKLWMSFSTDTRHISATQGRSNLELKEITFAM